MLNNHKQILLGDNPFFGIDHLSQERARKRMQKLNTFSKMTDVMEFVSSLGVKGFVVSTHPQMRDLIKHMQDNTNILKNYEFYPILPYAQGYVSKVTEKGITNTINDLFSQGNIQTRLKIIFKGSSAWLKKDFEKLFETFIDVELLPFSPTKKKIIFLHNAITDLAISLGMKKVIQSFTDHIEKQYGVKPGLVTLNFPSTVKTLEKWGIKPPVIMTPINPLGYQMNPSQEECENYLSKANVMAMNVLAGGLLKPKESFNYISKLDINSVVIGMSSKDHAKETIEIFQKLNLRLLHKNIK